MKKRIYPEFRGKPVFPNLRADQFFFYELIQEAKPINLFFNGILS